MKRIGLVLGAAFSVGVVSAVAWGVAGGPRSALSHGTRPAVLVVGAARGVRGEAGVHGGPIERFHRPGACDLVSLSGLPGNRTHGDYVAAVEALGDPALVPIAARSDCGKPMVAVDRRGGPPAHALENRARAQERAERARAGAPAEPPFGS